ncbi:MAG: YceI family protein [Bacteroidetes bacterium]|nr:YceI family protein [Bacteroidota bacterium]
MKLVNILSVILLAAVLAAGCGKSGVKTGDKQEVSKKSGKTLNVSVSDSKINWTGKKVTGQHNGTIDIIKGEVYEDNGKVTGGFVEIDMNSIKDLDLKDSSFNAKLVNHLKSDDFFNASKYPVSKFEITKVTELNDASMPNVNATVTGNLTIRDVTKSIIFPAEIKIESGVLKCKADVDIDRTDWNVKYGSGKFFENLGDKMINDVFSLALSILAK